MNIVVNRTASFYVGRDREEARAAVVAPAVPLELPPTPGVEKKLRFDPDYQARLSEIAQRTRLTFPDVMLKADPLKDVGPEARSRPLATLDDVRLR